MELCWEAQSPILREGEGTGGDQGKIIFAREGKAGVISPGKVNTQVVACRALVTKAQTGDETDGEMVVRNDVGFAAMQANGLQREVNGEGNGVGCKATISVRCGDPVPKGATLEGTFHDHADAYAAHDDIGGAVGDEESQRAFEA